MTSYPKSELKEPVHEFMYHMFEQVLKEYDSGPKNPLIPSHEQISNLRVEGGMGVHEAKRLALRTNIHDAIKDLRSRDPNSEIAIILEAMFVLL